MIHENLITAIGNTPLVKIGNTLCKLECFNPGGSAKDRAALSMILAAEQQGLLHPGSTIIEPTSGNTGIGLAWVGKLRGYRVILTMPDTMSMERQQLIRAYGAEIILTEGKLGMQGAVNKAAELQAELPDAFIPDQFSNPANAEAHYRTTGPELWQQTEGKIDVFVAGVGTGGTITGVGRYLKEKNPKIEIVAVEPAASSLLSGGSAGAHKIQGIGANFIPALLDRTVYDRVFPVADQDAISAAVAIAKTAGLPVGISSGAAWFAAQQLASREEYAEKTVVALLPDTGTRYLSTGIFG